MRLMASLLVLSVLVVSSARAEGEQNSTEPAEAKVVVTSVVGVKSPYKGSQPGYEHLQLSVLTLNNTGEPAEIRMRMSVNGKFHSKESLGTIPAGKTGLAVSDSLYGPWKKLGIVCEPPKNDPEHWTNNRQGINVGIHCAVPVKFKGKWYLYVKAGSLFQHDYLGVAVADKPEGPSLPRYSAPSG